MRKIIHWITIGIFSYSFLLLTKPVDAAQFELYPRLETGITNYSIQYSALSESVLTLPGQTSGYNQTSEKTEYHDYLSYIGGGGTLFINRFYIDLSKQYTFDGSHSSPTAYSFYEENEDDLTLFASAEAQRQSEFDHTDSAIAMGYAISRHLSLFVGYKWTDLDLKSRLDGSIYTVFTNIGYIGHSLAHIINDGSFQYEGPFIGATHGWEFDTKRYFKGMLSFKLGLAFLNSKYTNVRKVALRDTRTNEITTWVDHEETKGHTWGFTLGLGWRGNTPIENLTYSLKISGYRYNFDNDNAVLGDISESVLNYTVGATYAF